MKENDGDWCCIARAGTSKCTNLLQVYVAQWTMQQVQRPCFEETFVQQKKTKDQKGSESQAALFALWCIMCDCSKHVARKQGVSDHLASNDFAMSNMFVYENDSTCPRHLTKLSGSTNTWVCQHHLFQRTCCKQELLVQLSNQTSKCVVEVPHETENDRI